MAYGNLAEILYGHVQKGSRIGVEGHIQMRERPNSTSPTFEVVAEHVEFLRHIDYDRGNQVMEELKARGKLQGGKNQVNPAELDVAYVEGNSQDVVRVE